MSHLPPLHHPLPTPARTRPYPTPTRWLPLGALALLLAGCASRPMGTTVTLEALGAPSTAAAPATFINARAIIIVRHADVDVAEKRLEGNATPLLPRGEERAKELAYALKDAGVTRILTTAALRTQETAAVLAKELKIKVEVTSGAGGFDASGDPLRGGEGGVLGLMARTAKPTDVILLVDHHSLIPSLMKDLGYPDEPEFANKTEFDRIYILLPDARTKKYELLRLRYGGDWHLGG